MTTTDSISTEELSVCEKLVDLRHVRIPWTWWTNDTFTLVPRDALWTVDAVKVLQTKEG